MPTRTRGTPRRSLWSRRRRGSSGPWLRVTGDRENRDLTPLRPVMPEDAVGSRGLLLGIDLEHIFAARSDHRLKLVTLESGVARVRFEARERPSYRAQSLGEAGVAPQLMEIRLRAVGQIDDEGGHTRRTTSGTS